MEIYCLNNSNFFSEESLNKGFRNDIFVSINNVYYKLTVYDKCRLIQDFDLEFSQEGSFVPEPNMLIVSTLENENIIKTIYAAYHEGLFDYFSACSLDGNYIIYLKSSTQMKIYDEIGRAHV